MFPGYGQLLQQILPKIGRAWRHLEGAHQENAPFIWVLEHTKAFGVIERRLPVCPY